MKRENSETKLIREQNQYIRFRKNNWVSVKNKSKRRNFCSKSKQEQDTLFVALLDAPVMHVDGTVARVNGTNNHVVVCSNGAATMYFARV